MQIDFFCICKHEKSYHSIGNFFPECSLCADEFLGLYDTTGYKVISENAYDYEHEFKVDNLRYLEQLDEYRTLRS